MAARPDTAFWTAEMVRALPDDGKRYETIHGELQVSPAPRKRHQIVLTRMHNVVTRYLESEPAGMVLSVAADISWAPDLLVQPDLFVIPSGDVGSDDWADVQRLLLVAEVLSPSTTRWDRMVKRHLYQKVGIPLYWVVDADQHLVECWTPDATEPVIEREQLIWHPAGADTSCVIDLAEIFAPVRPN